MTKSQAIDAYVKQYSGVGHEHDIKMPHIGWTNMLKEMITKRAHSIYQALNTSIGVPTDVLIMLEHNREVIPILRDYYHSPEPSSPDDTIGKKIETINDEIA